MTSPTPAASSRSFFAATAVVGSAAPIEGTAGTAKKKKEKSSLVIYRSEPTPVGKKRSERRRNGLLHLSQEGFKKSEKRSIIVE